MTAALTEPTGSRLHGREGVSQRRSHMAQEDDYEREAVGRLGESAGVAAVGRIRADEGVVALDREATLELGLTAAPRGERVSGWNEAGEG